MEETQFPAPPEAVSFPTAAPIGPRKKGNKLIYIIIAFLLVIGLITFLVFKGSGASEEIEVTPAPEEQLEDVATPQPEETATPAPEVDKEDVEIKILNGTGVSGEAGYLSGQLKALGYKTIDTGNASSSDATVTEVVFSSSMSSTIVDEITTKLKELYKSVESSTSNSLSVDVEITTGPRKGVTTSTSSPKPSPSATPAQ